MNDLSGMKFGELTAIKPDGKVFGYISWSCLCSCGNLVSVRSSYLVSGHTRSCGHLKPKSSVAGVRFGRLAAVKEDGRTKNGHVKWLCKCDCGNEVSVSIQNLRGGQTTSCKCLQKETSSKRAKVQFTTHGLSKTKEYKNAYSRNSQSNRRGLDSGWTPQMGYALVKFFPACVICGETEQLSTDHVRPHSKGNKLEPGNAIRLCSRCNSRKHSKNPEELPSNIAEKVLKAADEFRKFWATGQLELFA